MQTKKINLNEFKKECLEIKRLLEIKGGSCNSSSSINMLTQCCTADIDTSRRDPDY